MDSELVLITGGTGHIGFRTMVLALEAGYRVRAAVRREVQAVTVRCNPAIQSLRLPSGALSFVEVPNITSPGAYDQAVRGVKFIIHVASTIPSGAPDKDPAAAQKTLIDPAVKGTLGMLQSAANEESKSVQRIVITSSVVAQFPSKFWMGQPSPGMHFDSDSRTDFEEGPYNSLMAAYCASKIASLNAAEEWMRTNNPPFDVIHTHPARVIGRNDLSAAVASGSNGSMMRIVLGETNETPFPASCVHSDDVARVQLMALDPKIKGNQSFTLSVPCVWQDATAITARHFPLAVSRGLLPNNGVQPTTDIDIDSSKTEDTFGIKLRPFEEQVKSVVRHYIELGADDIELLGHLESKGGTGWQGGTRWDGGIGWEGRVEWDGTD